MSGKILRISFLGRVFHFSHVILTFLLILSGLKIYYPKLIFEVPPEWIIMAQEVLGLAWVTLPLAALALRFRSTVHFLSEYTRWTLDDLVWLVKFVPGLIRPDKYHLPLIKTKINPGERLVGASMIAVSSALAVTGLIRVWGDWVSPGLLVRAEAIHRVSFLLLLLFLAGHITVGLGILPSYRGVARAMFGDGQITLSLAGRHWPYWTRQNLLGEWPPPVKWEEALRAGIYLSAVAVVLALAIFYPPTERGPAAVRALPPTDGLEDGSYRGAYGRVAIRAEVRGGKTRGFEVSWREPVDGEADGEGAAGEGAVGPVSGSSPGPSPYEIKRAMMEALRP